MSASGTGGFPDWKEDREEKRKVGWISKKKDSNQVFWPKGVNGRKEPKLCQQILASALSYDDAIALIVVKVTVSWPQGFAYLNLSLP